MKTLMIDMDNVITDTIFLDLINEFLKTNYKLSDLKSYYMQDLIIDRKDEFWNWVKDKSFYHKAPLVDGCFGVLEKLNKFYDIYIVTAYIWNKYYYLREKLPFINPEKYIFTTNKNIINFDIRIDDKLDNIINSETKLLFTAWHNKDLSDEYLEKNGVIRVNNWYDIEKVLIKENELVVN